MLWTSIALEFFPLPLNKCHLFTGLCVCLCGKLNFHFFFFSEYMCNSNTRLINLGTYDHADSNIFMDFCLKLQSTLFQNFSECLHFFSTRPIISWTHSFWNLCVLVVLNRGDDFYSIFHCMWTLHVHLYIL